LPDDCLKADYTTVAGTMLQQSSSVARAAQALLAVGSGLALFGAGLLITGFLAAIAIPTEYFAYFGRQHTALALFVLNTLTVAVPLAAIGFLWGWAAVRFVRLPIASVAALCLLGFLVGLGYSYVALIMNFMALEADGKVPLSVFLRSGFTWWNSPQLVAVPLGIVGGATLRARSLRSAQ
jgi:hypothetical protein